VGGMIAVAEAARNLACAGADPLAITDCLNFGNPEKPEAFWQFRRAVEGIADACRFFDIPVISGNVSFYNETPERAIFPTPVIGMVGILQNVERRCTQGFKADGDVVVLIGDYPVQDPSDLGLGGSEYLAVIHGIEAGRPPKLDLAHERAVQNVVRTAVEQGILSSAHDTSEGGLAVALAECCISGRLGARVSIPRGTAAELFGERQSRVIVSVSKENLDKLARIAAAEGVPITELGEVGGKELQISDHQKNAILSLKVEDMESAWRGAIGCLMS